MKGAVFLFLWEFERGGVMAGKIVTKKPARNFWRASKRICFLTLLWRYIFSQVWNLPGLRTRIWFGSPPQSNIFGVPGLL